MSYINSIRLSAVTLGAFSLAACSGGGGSVDLSQDTNDVAVAAVVADGTDSLNDTISFPIRYSLISQPDGTPSIAVGTGQITVIDDNTIDFVRQEGDSPVRLEAIADGNPTFTGAFGGGTITVNLAEGGGAILAYMQGDVEDNGFGIAGVYGFETAVGDLPGGTIDYNIGGEATAFIAVDDDNPENIQVIQDGHTNPSLSVNFGTGDVSGDLFEGTALVDLQDDTTADDTLNLTVSITNGAVNDGVITGNIFMSADVDIGGTSDNIDLNPTVSSSSVDANVYGATGNVVGGTFEGAGTFNDGTGALNYGIGGTFFTVGTVPPAP